MSPPTLEQYLDIDDRWRWRLLAPNGLVLADATERFEARSTLESALEAVREQLVDASVFSIDGPRFFVEPGHPLRLLDARARTVATTTDPGEERLGAARRIDRAGGDPLDVDWEETDDEGTRVDRLVTQARDADPLVLDGAGYLCHHGHDDEWRWTARLNGRDVAESGEGYRDAETARRMAERTASAIGSASIRVWG